MSVAMDAFQVLSGQQNHVVYRRPAGAPDDGSQDVLIPKRVWMEDAVTREYRAETERTEWTGTLIILESTGYSETDQWVINGDLWTLHHSAGSDSGLRNIHVRRDAKVKTGGGNHRMF